MSVNDLALWLKQQRGRRGLTQEALAELSHVAPQTITAYETGSRRPSVGTLARIADAFRLDYAERIELHRLAGYVSPPPPPPPAQPQPQPSAAPLRAKSLPRPLLLGREAELAALVEMLVLPEVRLITLSGPPGVGKTRLALAALEAVYAQLPDGSVYVDLVDCVTAEQVEQAIAAACGLSMRTDLSRDELLAAHFQSLRMLLVLDHCEQAPLGALCAFLLGGCPTLTILLGSAVPLRLAYTHHFPLAPLSSVDAGSGQLSPALALFVERARAVKPSFELNETNRAEAVTICTLLDGLPLGIELAAACLRTLTTREIARRLAEQLPLPAPNHYAMSFDEVLRGAVRQITKLLTADQQAVFCCMAAFVGGCSLEALAAASGWSEPEAELRLLNSIEGLVDHSLVQMVAGEDTEPRFAMLHTIQALAAEELTQSGAAASVFQRLAFFYRACAEQAASQLRGPERQQALWRFEADYANMLASLQRALAGDDVEMAAWLAGALGEFWLIRGHWQAGRELIERILRQREQLPPPLTTLLLRYAGLLVRRLGDYVQAQQLFVECLTRYTIEGDSAACAYIVNLLGLSAIHQGNYASARRCYEESLAIWQSLGSPRNVAAVKSNLAALALAQGDYLQARALCDEVLQLHYDRNDLRGVSRVLCHRGMLALYQGNYAEAGEYFRSSLANIELTAEPAYFALLESNLGFALLLAERPDQAAVQFRQSLELSRRLGGQRELAYSLEGLACIALHDGGAEEALRLFSAAALLYERMGFARPAVEQALAGNFVNQARAQCGPACAEAAWALGRSMSLAQVMRAALAVRPLG